MGNNQELIWVDKDFADKYKELMSDKSKREEQEKVFNGYMESVFNTVRNDFEANLESLEEDAAMFTGLMIKVKKAFETAKNEHINASYDLWEKFEKEIPSTREKIDKIVNILKPLKVELETINSLINNISIRDIERFNEIIRIFSNSCDKNKEIIEFLIRNFKEDKN